MKIKEKDIIDKIEHDFNYLKSCEKKFENIKIIRDSDWTISYRSNSFTIINFSVSINYRNFYFNITTIYTVVKFPDHKNNILLYLDFFYNFFYEYITNERDGGLDFKFPINKLKDVFDMIGTFDVYNNSIIYNL